MRKLIAKYTASGVISIIAQFSLLSFLVEWVNIGETLASAIAFIIAGVINYLMLYHWAFESQGMHKHTATRYTIVLITMLVLNTFLFWVLANQFQIWYIYAQYAASTVVAGVNFLANKNYTFS